MIAPRSSVLVKALLRKYPELCTDSFTAVTRVWGQADASVTGHVDAKERQALGHAAMGSSDAKNDRFTAAHWAACHGYCDVLSLIQQQNQDALLEADSFGLRPVHWAARGGHVDSFRTLVQIEGSRGSKGRSLPLHVGDRGCTVATLAAQFDHVAVLQWMSDPESKLSALLTVSESWKYRRTPLLVAASCDAFHALEFLLRHEQVTNSTSRDALGRTAVHYAAEGSHLRIIKALDACNRAMLLEKDMFMATALHYAARNPRTEGVFAYLHQEVRLPLWDQDAEGRYPITWAVLGGKTSRHIAVVDYIYKSSGCIEGPASPVRNQACNLLSLAQHKHGTTCQLYQRVKELSKSKVTC